MLCPPFFFNDPSPTEIYTLSLHDALPIFSPDEIEIRITDTGIGIEPDKIGKIFNAFEQGQASITRSEEHTSELQSQFQLVCRLLPEKKNTTQVPSPHTTTVSGQAQSARVQ